MGAKVKSEAVVSSVDSDSSVKFEESRKFEQSLGELEGLIGKLEAGELSLDETVHSFSHGMALYETCKNALDQAQLRVELLLKGSADLSARVPFEAKSP